MLRLHWRSFLFEKSFIKINFLVIEEATKSVPDNASEVHFSEYTPVEILCSCFEFPHKI
jgi:hypothetical protein